MHLIFWPPSLSSLTFLTFALLGLSAAPDQAHSDRGRDPEAQKQGRRPKRLWALWSKTLRFVKVLLFRCVRNTQMQFTVQVFLILHFVFGTLSLYLLLPSIPLVKLWKHNVVIWDSLLSLNAEVCRYFCFCYSTEGFSPCMYANWFQ